MKLAMSNLAWSVGDDAAVAGVLSAEDVHGVELAPSKVWADAPNVARDDASAYALAWRSRGCSIVAFQAILFGHPELDLFGDAFTVTALQRHLVAVGQLASACGAAVLVLGAPGNRRRGERSMGAAIDAAATALRPVADRLGPMGIALCIEPNPPRYGCDFVTTAAEAAVLADAVDHPGFGIHLDTAALAASGEVSMRALAPVMRWVRHAHLSEIDLAPVGTGTMVQHAVVGAALRDAGYEGWLSVEMRLGAGDDWRVALPRAAAVAREHYLR